MLGILVSNAYAQAAPAQPSALMNMVPLVLVVLVFYFLMLRPQKKKMEQEQKYISGLKHGDEVYTKAGILGKIHGITDKIITLEVEDGSRMKVLKSQVAGPTKDLFPAPTDAKKK
ncbi:MAG: preprotein translocase subunit YajC [Bacteriovoracaceae bacterium]|jgi:preprotein translocase subunit YajC|nr:preprotein translocase subunit YajC [Halobacteriovoraceae bacterium]MAX68065.1 preprotein translocase subunit YajC [Halobacteriovoraceae bacterium]MDP7321072.1 preprotein translocase subunit YajC [Bacteriovoracaceae bacterium]|tara:strand:+ start:229 stop:573 length:345 start_codon:yes stop_codon:yes gene_type:complete